MSRAASLAREIRNGVNAVAGRGTAFTHQPLGTHIDPAGLAGYYCDFRHKAIAAAGHADGFPRSSSRGGRAEWAIPVAQCALGYWELKLEGRPEGSGFRPLADWLVDAAEEAADGLVWRSPFSQHKYGLATGWPSAMAQGEAISVLVRAHADSGSEHYLEVARAAFEPLAASVADGGVRAELAGATVLEEYPTASPSAVLNGWIFALFGVHELAVATGHDRARSLFDRSLDGLLGLLPRYDAGWWSLYSLYDHGRPDLAKPFYQRLHPVLLDALALIRPDDRLRHWARRWEDQLTWPSTGRAVLDKVVFRVSRSHDRAGAGQERPAN